MFIDNNWYGNRYILSKYCKVKHAPIFGSLQHGLLLASHFDRTKSGDQKLGYRRFKQIPWFVWNDYIVENTKKNKIKNVINIGSPMIYLNEILKYQKFAKPKGTLVIPCRSVYEVKYVVDYDKLIKSVKNKFEPPYIILVGYFDLANIFKIRHSYKDCRFVTCGKRKNLNYSYKLYKYIKECNSIVNFYPGTPILYSLFLKKKTYFINNRFLIKTTIDPMIMKSENYKVNSKKNLKNKKKIDVNIKQIIKDDQIGVECFKKEYGIDLFKLNKKIHYNKALLALGYNKKRSPKKLAKILGWNNFLKKNLAKLLKIVMNIKYKEITIINKY
jgi:hypothetical protein